MVKTIPLFSSLRASEWSAGRLCGDPACEVFTVEVDSRRCGAGSLFIALGGEHVDGHDFINQVFEKGACGAVVSEGWADVNEDLISRFCESGCFFLIVVDPLSALQQIASAYMRGISHPVRIGITGSNGKTTTKEIIAAVLAEKYSVVKTAGNYNSEIGLPLTVFNIKNSHDYAVIEMGVNRMGEMDVLSEILRPDIVVITNIGTAHIGIFNDIDTIASEKRRAVSHFTGKETLFISEDERFADFLSEELKGKAVIYGEKSLRALGYDLEYKNLGIRGWEIKLNDQLINFPLVGEHNLVNAFCAIAVGLFLEISVGMIKNALEKTAPLFGRSQIINGPVTVIQDCYNANADSLRHSIEFADDLDWQGNKIYVLGDMKELGVESGEVHRFAGRMVVSGSASKVIFFGDDSSAAYEEAVTELQKKGKTSPELYHTTDFEELKNKTLNELKSGDLLLLKGSRSMNLERLLEPVAEKFRGGEC